MTDQSFFHMNVLRSPYQMPNFGYPGPTFMDIRSKEAEIAGCEGMSSTNSRILELRKEKSRDAARSRRGKENYEFYELAKLLPLPAAITSQLDKASIIRLSISYLKLRDFSSHGDPPWHREGPPPNKSIKGGPPRRRNMTAVAMEIFESHQGTHILQSLDGFGFALSNDGRFLYISETVSIYLGLSQVEMTGSSVFDYVHVKDHSELAEHLGLAIPQGGVPSPGSLSDNESSTPRSASPSLPDKTCIMNPNQNKSPDHSFCIRMKSTLTKRGVHVKSSGYRVVHIIAHHRPQFSFSLSRKQSPPLLGLVALAIALPPPTVTELHMESDTFVMRLSPEFKVLYCEPRIGELMDLTAEDITNNVLYDHCHAADLQKLRKSHVDLLDKGQVMTEYYRLMNKHGGYVWIQTCATTICTAKNLEEQNVVTLNYVLSGVEFQGCVMDSGQLKSMPNQETDHSDHSDTGSDQENDRRKESKEEPISRERTHVGENEVSRFGSTSKSSLSTTKTLRCNNNHKDFPLDSHRGSPQSSPIIDNDSVFLDRPECVKTELGKNSRRKMDRPRKRKREVESDTDVNGIDSFEDDGSQTVGGTLTVNSHPLHNGNPSISPDLTSSPQPLLGVSPVPEDLSIKPVSSPPIGLPSAMPVGTALPDINNSNSSADVDWSKTSSGGKEEGMTSSSVKDLEEAMNKHLPVLPAGSTDARTPDPVSDRPESSCLHGKQKSTIQWIGSQQPSPDPLAASNLLRSLYANRESVIRTNICNTRPPHYYGDPVAVSMLTPPGNDSYKDPPQMSLHPLQYPSGKQPTNHHTNMSSYTNTPITVSMTTHVTDTSYNMTPPSSVSPQDKFVSPFSEGGYVDGPSPHLPPGAEDSCQRIPVKPQLYSVPMPAHLPAYSDRSAHLTYPNISTYNSTGASFPAYTASSTNLGAEPNSSWYASHFATP